MPRPSSGSEPKKARQIGLPYPSTRGRMRVRCATRPALSPRALIPAPCFEWLTQARSKTYHRKRQKVLQSAYMNSPLLRQLTALGKGIRVKRGSRDSGGRALPCGSLTGNNRCVRAQAGPVQRGNHNISFSLRPIIIQTIEQRAVQSVKFAAQPTHG
jgi:hypothetical protein